LPQCSTLNQNSNIAMDRWALTKKAARFFKIAEYGGSDPLRMLYLRMDLAFRNGERRYITG